MCTTVLAVEVVSPSSPDGGVLNEQPTAPDYQGGPPDTRYSHTLRVAPNLFCSADVGEIYSPHHPTGDRGQPIQAGVMEGTPWHDQATGTQSRSFGGERLLTLSPPGGAPVTLREGGNFRPPKCESSGEQGAKPLLPPRGAPISLGSRQSKTADT